MRSLKYVTALIVLCAGFFSVHALAAEIHILEVNGDQVSVDWTSTASAVTLHYKEANDIGWTSVMPTGASYSLPIYSGVTPTGAGTVKLNYGTYTFRLMECGVFPSAVNPDVDAFLCGANQSYFMSVFHGQVVISEPVNIQGSHLAEEFATPLPSQPTLQNNQIRAVALNQFGKVSFDWRGAQVTSGFVELGYTETSTSSGASILPGVNGIPSTQVSIPFSSTLHTAIPLANSAEITIPVSGTYVFSMKTCRFVSQNQGDVGTKYCSAAVMSPPVIVEGLDLSNLPPLVSFDAPALGSSETVGKAVVIRASAMDPAISGIPNSANQIAKVDFYISDKPGQMVDPAKKVASVAVPTSGFYQYTFTPNQTGDYYLVAVATDSAGATAYAVNSIRVLTEPAVDAQPNNTVPVDYKRFAVYYGDFDNDGNRDIYFHGKPLFIILHGDIAIPIAIPSPPGFAFFGTADGSYVSASAWDMTDDALQACETCKLGEQGKDYLLNDMNSDGNQDILVLGENPQTSSLLVSGVEGAALPQVLLEIMSSGQTRKPGQQASRTPYFTDNLSSGLPELANGQIIVNGVGHTLASLQMEESNQGAAQASDQSIAASPTPNLPSPSLSAAEISEIDALSSVGGEFRVNEAGASTYTVPLALPVGTAGVAPEISLTYSSQSGAGDMGLGWSFAFGRRISRCRQTLITDGQAQPIRFSEADRFCLDGQRLLLSKGSAYGASGAEYKPEIDSGIIVTSVGGTLGHPNHFIVTGKDGSVSILGGNDDARQSGYASTTASSPQANRVMSWRLSEFQDSVGNSITYTYESSIHFHRLKAISYAYGDSSTAAVVIDFGYGVRKQADVYWVAGSRFAENSLLNTIAINDNNELLREYLIEYNHGVYETGDDEIDRVVNIRSCLGGQCSRPLRMDWGFASAGAANLGNGKVKNFKDDIFSINQSDVQTNGFPSERISVPRIAEPRWNVNNYSLSSNASGYWYYSHQESDIDGDGSQDILLVEAYTGSFKRFNLYSIRQTASGFASKHYVDHLSGNPDAKGRTEAPYLLPVDFNADGRMDLAVYLPSSQLWSTYFSRPQLDGTWALKKVEGFLPSAVNDTSVPVDNVRFADMDSDGLPDAVYTKAGNLYVHYLKRKQATATLSDAAINASNQAFAFHEAADLSQPAAMLDIYNFSALADLNEDGRVDVIGTNYILTPNSTTVAPTGTSPGYTDVSCNYRVEFQSLITENNGSFQTGATTEVAQGSFDAREIGDEKIVAKCDLSNFRRRTFGPYLSDINADGLTDLVWAFGQPGVTTWKHGDHDPDYNTRTVWYKLGNSDLTFGEQKSVTLDSDFLGFELMDKNLDGNPDIVLHTHQNRRVALWVGSKFSTSTTEIPSSNGARYSDVNGDGALDKSLVSDGKLAINLGMPKSNNAVIKFHSGLGATTAVFYEPLRDSGRYTKLAGISETVTLTTMPAYCIPLAENQGGGCVKERIEPVYGVDSSDFYLQINDPFANVDPDSNLHTNHFLPTQEIIGAMPVVTRVVSSAPTGNNSDALAGVDYSYEGQKLQAGGRGFLGFKKLMTTDMQTGIATETEYRQDWPFMGAPVKTVTKTRHGTLLKESINTMAIVGIDQANISAKRIVARQGTAKLGPLVLYAKETRDITYDIPESQLTMPDGAIAEDTASYSILSEVVTTTATNASGNVEELVAITLDGSGNPVHTQTTTNLYYPDEGERFGRLQSTTVTTERPSVPEQVRTAEFTYYGFPGASCASGGGKLKGLLCTEKISVSNLENSEAPEMTTHYYDDFGNSVYTKSGSRVSAYTEYDRRGRFVYAGYDVFRRETGLGTAVAGYFVPDGAVAVRISEVLTRDKFGNALLSRAAVGSGDWIYSVQAATPRGKIYFKGDSSGAFEETRMQRTLLSNANWCPLGTAYISVVNKAGGAEATQCFDKMGRDIGAYVMGFNGDVIRTRKDYDRLGRLERVYEPAKNAVPSLFASTKYDVLGRPKLVTHPFSVTSTAGIESSIAATTQYQYDGFKTTTIVAGHSDGVDRTKVALNNALGELVRITEMGGRSIEYNYDALGKLTDTIDPASNRVTIQYNSLGQKYRMVDPDKGTWEYHYNRYGELTRQMDANGTTTNNSYDFKGRRVAQEVNPANSDYQGQSTLWDYDLVSGGLGQLGRETKLVDGKAVFTRQYSFDGLGRASETTSTFVGASGVEEKHHQKVTYDQYGRVFQTFDAARTGPQFSYNGVQNHYNAFGYMDRVDDAANGGSAPFYTVKAMDARNNVTQMLYGSGETVIYSYHRKTGFLTDIRRENGIATAIEADTYHATWDHLGNLVNRSHELLGGTVETFAYDQYNRLVSNSLSATGGGSPTTVSVEYDLLDNIKTKSDVENGADYQYDAEHVHGVNEVGNRSFKYDANGNVVEEWVGDVGSGTLRKRLSYTANNLAQKIEVLGSDNHTSEFFYDSANRRYKRIDRDNTGKITTTLYLGGVEKITHFDGSVEWKRQIGAVAQVTHQVTAGKADGGTRYYFHKDHLGSTVAISDQTGEITQRMAFDPWGARRTVANDDSWQPSAMTHSSILVSFAKTAKPVTNRGFTGHEMLDEVGIVHMNGRIYDATLGRFLQADPLIQEPTMVGSLNRYSYAMNNPLNAVDPSGFSWLSKTWDKLRPYVGVIVGVAVGYFCGPCGASIIEAALTGAAIGAVSAAANGGNIMKGALMGFISGAAFSAIGLAFSDCGATCAGATFGTKLNSAAFAGKVLAHGAAGGVMSVLQGGKFGHGFASAGVTQAFAGAIDSIGGNMGSSEWASAGNRALRIASAAVVGGTASSMSGGKFANGALTGAFSRAFNDEAHVQKAKLTHMRKILYDTLERSDNYGTREEGYIIYEGDNGELLSTNKLVGERSSLIQGLKFGVAENGDGYIMGGQLGLDKAYKMIEVLHTHPDGSSSRFSGGEGGDVWFAEKFNTNVSVSYHNRRRFYEPRGDVNLESPRSIRERSGSQLE